MLYVASHSDITNREESILQAEISDVQISSEDGFIYCSFVTPKTMTLTHYDRKHNADGSHVEPPEFTKVTKQMNLDEENYLLLAVGDVYQG